MRLAPAINLAAFVMTVASTGLAQTPAPVLQPTRTAPVLRSAGTYSNNQKGSQNAADKRTGEIDKGSVVRVSTSLITVALVMDRNGRYIANLRKEDFRVYEDAVEHSAALARQSGGN